MSHSAQSKRTIAVIGGSISAGLGVAGHSYVDLLAERCNNQFRIQNFSASGQSILNSLDRLTHVIACRPDVVIVAHGGFDAVVRPTGNARGWILPRWRRKGWLDPRPFYSPKLLKGVYQRIESAGRWRYRILLMKIFGAAPWVSPADFMHAAQTLTRRLIDETEATVLLLTPMGIDGRLYPGTPQAMARCEQVLRTISEEFASTDRVKLLDVSHLLHRDSDFFDDGFHPNALGHQRLADAVWASLS